MHNTELSSAHSQDKENMKLFSKEQQRFVKKGQDCSVTGILYIPLALEELTPAYVKQKQET